MRSPIVLAIGALLLLAGCDKASRKPSGTASAPPAPPPPLPVVAIADVPPPSTPEVELKPGSNLGIVAQDAYGHERFSGFLSVVNGITDPTKIRDGTELKTPAIPVAFQDAGVDPAYQPAINALAKAATDYFAQSGAFRGALSATTESGKPELSPGVTSVFTSSADAVDAAVAVLEEAKPPHTVPKKSIEQFRQASTHLRKLAKGDIATDDYSQDLVGQRFGLGFTNALLWTKAQHQ
ncbi:hypothetical protein OVA24_08350 [Luteolibacter sp. SL250]|uniref:hypothetical protein n=1 Tax=Luteolibacter sp. SL250 TaxID=2995170 RepID=UPI002272174E|nr:hypothetical protein [Luteolibacter sp. SL250]WAC21396.1 hypothetical protein OVA24_08350 [Luteolibacter sp. SL250]